MSLHNSQPFHPYSVLQAFWWRSSHVYFSIFKPLLQIFVYGFIRDFTDQGEIRNSNFLLLGCVECGFFDIWFAASTLSSLCIARSLVPFISTSSDTLEKTIALVNCNLLCNMKSYHIDMLSNLAELMRRDQIWVPSRNLC